jgi:hypothetical protein
MDSPIIDTSCLDGRRRTLVFRLVFVSFSCARCFACCPAVLIPCTPFIPSPGHGPGPCLPTYSQHHHRRPVRASRAHCLSLHRLCSPRSPCSRRTTAWAAPTSVYLNNMVASTQVTNLLGLRVMIPPCSQLPTCCSTRNSSLRVPPAPHLRYYCLRVVTLHPLAAHRSVPSVAQPQPRPPPQPTFQHQPLRRAALQPQPPPPAL